MKNSPPFSCSGARRRAQEFLELLKLVLLEGKSTSVLAMKLGTPLNPSFGRGVRACADTPCTVSGCGTDRLDPRPCGGHGARTKELPGNATTELAQRQLGVRRCGSARGGGRHPPPFPLRFSPPAPPYRGAPGKIPPKGRGGPRGRRNQHL